MTRALEEPLVGDLMRLELSRARVEEVREVEVARPHLAVRS
jgi:hypothetical protein